MRETRTSRRCCSSSACTCHVMPNASATSANCSLKSLAATGASTCTRRKKVDVRGLPYCCESRMLQSRTARKPDTACTMPGRSGHDRVRTSSLPGTSSPCHAGRGELGALDRRDVELELDLLADEDAALVEADVPLEAPVAAVDGRLALEAGPEVAPRVVGGAGDLEVDRDRVGATVDGQV